MFSFPCICVTNFSSVSNCLSASSMFEYVCSSCVVSCSVWCNPNMKIVDMIIITLSDSYTYFMYCFLFVVLLRFSKRVSFYCFACVACEYSSVVVYSCVCCLGFVWIVAVFAVCCFLSYSMFCSKCSHVSYCCLCVLYSALYCPLCCEFS